MTHLWAWTGVTAAGALLLTGCVTPATGADSYRGKASLSIEAATSEVETTRIAVQALLDDRILEPYADETISATETALGAISDAFGSVQPPRGSSDDLRDTVTTLVSDAEDAVASARIAARRSDDTGMQDALTALDAVADRLTDAGAELQ